MYRNTQHSIIRHLTRLVIASCMLTACVDEDDLLSPWSVWEQGLLVQPAIVGSNMTTRAYDYYDNNTYSIDDDVPADDELKENDLGTRLDVFIAGQGNDPFWMQYHLVKGQETVQNVTANVLDQTADLLAKNWSDVEDPNNNKLVNGRTYDVYVAVNNPVTNGTIASKAALLALTYQNVKVHKLYGNETTGSYDASRRMLMEGHVAWRCTNEPLQRIEVPLKRAEVKVVATIDISPAFLAQLRAETGLDTPIGTPTATAPFNGTPAWKYVNWCIDTKVFADGNDITPALLTDPEREDMTENTLLNQLPYFYYNGKEMDEQGALIDNTTTEVYFTDNIDDTDEYGRRYTLLYPVDASATDPYDGRSVQRMADDVPRARLITYTYASSWGDEAQEKAPYILVSYPFYRKKAGVTVVDSSDDLVTTFNYYRIPVCDEQTNTELKRNYIYKVNAIISGAGSTSFTQNETPVKLRYEVLPWTQDTSEEVKVKGESFHYFYVTPTTYTLRGDDTQSVDLNYYAATGDVVKFRNLQVYYYNSSGAKVYIYGSTANERNAVFDSKSLTNNDAGRNYSVSINNNGTISVSSEALNNRAVKYIAFTAYMTYTDENNVTNTIEQDIVIKHFPLDNIQNIEGSWSSKYESITTGTLRQYSWDPTADGWDHYDGFESNVKVEVPRGTSGATKEQETLNSRDAWRQNVPQNYRQGANSERNSYLGADGYYYWGEESGSNVLFWQLDYDWRGGFLNAIPYRWTKLYRAKYYITRTRYYRDIPMPGPNINSDWVMWGDGITSSRTYSDANFTAKVYDNGYCYSINQYNQRNRRYDNLTNNHMYVIQISSTSDQYVLGHANLDANFQSQDKVVSPAFMIASQLGAVQEFTGANAARNAAIHCGHYMEVGTDGTKYTGWRLPTANEISIISGYQNASTTSEIITEVLGGKHYYTLDGNTAEIPVVEDSEGNYVRCVRDITEEELEAINSKQ